MLNRLYQWMLAKAAHRHAEHWLAMFSFVESSFFPIPPHPLLGLMCLARPEKALRFGIICTIASVLGGLLGYAIGYFLYATVGASLLSALGLADKFPVAACYLRDYGAEIILIKGATPIPFKLITITAIPVHAGGHAVLEIRRADKELHREISWIALRRFSGAGGGRLPCGEHADRRWRGK